MQNLHRLHNLISFQNTLRFFSINSRQHGQEINHLYRVLHLTHHLLKVKALGSLTCLLILASQTNQFALHRFGSWGIFPYRHRQTFQSG